MNNVQQRDIVAETQESFLSYALSVIKDRALPTDVDGLKPVHRRILYGMFSLGTSSDKPHKKCARIVGEVLGKYHPHSDTAVYDAMVRLSQTWSLRYPLIDWHGNNGSLDGDSAAAMRYTEARLSKIGEEMLKNIKFNTVDFMPNFSEDELEPTCLPACFPHLIVNGTSGIAIGMASSFVGHNLNEVCGGIIAQLHNKDITTRELMNYISGPDLATGGTIINKDDLYAAYDTGRGKARVRASYTIDRNKIIFYEMTYGVSKESVIAKILEVYKGGDLPYMSRLEDESADGVMRLVVEVNSPEAIEPTLAVIFKKTDMEVTVSINQLALVNGEPVQLTLKDMIASYIGHQIEVLCRHSRFQLNKAQKRIEIVDGLLIGVTNIDRVIAIMKTSANTKIAVGTLMEEFGLSEVQAKAIVDLKIRALTGLEVDTLKSEQATLKETIVKLIELLGSEDKQKEKIEEMVAALASTYGDPRRTILTQVAPMIVSPKEKKKKQVEKIPLVSLSLSVTKKGFIKSTPISSINKTKTVKGYNHADFSSLSLLTDSRKSIILITLNGNYYRMPVAEAATFTPIEGDEIVAIIPAEDELYAIVTYLGKVKTILAADIISSKSRGKGTIIKLSPGDIVINAFSTNKPSSTNLLLGSSSGKVIEFCIEEVTPHGRVSGGSIGMKLSAEDGIVAAAIKDMDADTKTLVVSTDGRGKRTTFLPQKRGGVGVNGVPTDRTLSTILEVTDTDVIGVFSPNKSKLIKSSIIPIGERAALGNIMLKEEDVIAYKL